MTQDDTEKDWDEVDERFRIGHKKPPIATRFAPGKSGNNRGRPRKPTNPMEVITTELDRKITVTVDGKTQRYTTFQTLISKLIQGGLKGDLRAAREVFKYAVALKYAPSTTDIIEAAQQSGRLGEPKIRRLVSVEYLARLLEEIGVIQIHDNGDIAIHRDMFNSIMGDELSVKSKGKAAECLDLAQVKIIDP